MRVSVLDALGTNGTESKFEHKLMLVTKSNPIKKKEEKVFKEGESKELAEFIEGLKEKEGLRIFFDQSTNTGYSIFEGNTLIAVGKVGMGTGGSVESYKQELSTIINTFINHLKLEEVWYEEVYDSANMRTTEVLMYIKHIFKDLRYINRSKGIETRTYGVDHTTWKSILSDKKIKGTGDVKEQVREFVFKILPLEELDEDINEDMSDALGMGIARSIKLSDKYSFMMARYDSKLPIHEHVLIGQFNELETELKDTKLRKPFREARELGAIIYNVDTEGKLPIKPQQLARRVLTHTDKLVLVEIPEDYRDFGVIMLLNNIPYEEFSKEGSKVYLIFARKRRL